MEYSTVEISITCPACTKDSPAPAGIIAFRWGRIPDEYKHGDAIRWLADGSGEKLPSFKFAKKRNGYLTYNFGDPALPHVIAFDADGNLNEYSCPVCKTAFEAIAVEITHGRLTKGLAFLPGYCEATFGRQPSEVLHIEVTPAGHSIPRSEWTDTPIDSTDIQKY